MSLQESALRIPEWGLLLRPPEWFPEFVAGFAAEGWAEEGMRDPCREQTLLVLYS